MGAASARAALRPPRLRLLAALLILLCLLAPPSSAARAAGFSLLDPQSSRSQLYDRVSGEAAATLVSVVGGASTGEIDAVFLPPVPPAAVVIAERGIVQSDPDTGLVRVTVGRSARSDVQVLRNVSCPGGGRPAAATLQFGARSYPMAESPAGSGIFAATIPAADLAPGSLK